MIRRFELHDLIRPLRHILAPRELEVVHRLRNGLSNTEIGAKMGISEDTVKNYLKRVFECTGCKNRTLLAVRYEREEAAY